MIVGLGIRILLVFLTALVLSILPLPHVVAGFRPPFVLLALLYIQFFLPSYLNLAVTIALGLCLDVLLATILGEHVLALVIVTWIASTRVRRFRIFSLAQQMALITLLCFVYQFILYLVESYQGYNNTLPMVIGSTFISILIWPWVSLVLEQCLSGKYMVPSQRAKII